MAKAINPMRFSVLVITIVVLAVGCSAPWKAPVESRTGNRGADAIKGSSYRVRSGDTLYGIAWRAGLDYRDIARWNHINKPYTIYVGQKLRLKTPSGSKSTASTKPSKTTKSSNTTTNSSTKSTNKKTTSSKVTTSKNKSKIRAGKLAWAWPTKGEIIQGFSSNDETRKGIKIRGRKGQTIIAAEMGEVVYSGSGLVGYGELIIIKHNNEYLSAYGHNDKRLVKEGQRVAKGTKIAQMGMSGGKPLLHFEIRRLGKPVNPVGLLPRR